MNDAAPAAIAAAEFLAIPLTQVDLISTNPRRTRDPAKFAELVDNVRQVGILQPVLLRPNPEAPGRFIVVAGERRTRAAAEAGLESVPAIVRNLDDKEARSLTIFENLHREDLHPLEEAEGFEQLMALHGWTAEEMAERIGKSKAFVYARLKLTALIPAAREAYYEGKFDASVALLIARVPGQKLQAEALQEVLEHDDFSFREIARLIRDSFMLQLGKASFPINDASLSPDAGSCKDCPKRTGNAPELYGDVDNANVCTDPSCFKAKVALFVDRRKNEALARGLTVITGTEAKKLMPNSWLTPKGFYKANSEQVIDGGSIYKKPSALLKGADAPPATLVEVDGELIELWPKAETNRRLVAAGHINANPAIQGDSDDDYKAKEREDRAARKREQVVRHDVWKILRDELVSPIDRAELFQIALRRLVKSLSNDSTKPLVDAWSEYIKQNAHKVPKETGEDYDDEADDDGEDDGDGAPAVANNAYELKHLLCALIPTMDEEDRWRLVIDCIVVPTLTVPTYMKPAESAGDLPRLCEMAELNLDSLRQEHAEAKKKGKKAKATEPGSVA